MIDADQGGVGHPVAMKRIASAASLLLVVPGTSVAAVVVTATPAAAAVDCRVVEIFAGQSARFCEGTSARAGGVVELNAAWNYPGRGDQGRQGQVFVTIDDRTGGGCTVVKVAYRDPDRPDASRTVTRRRCGGRDSGAISVPLNQGRPFGVHRGGTYTVEHCEGRRDCRTIWRQRVGQDAPRR